MVVGFGVGTLFCDGKVLNLRWDYRFNQLMETHILERTFLNTHFGMHILGHTFQNTHFGTHILEHIF